MLPKNLIEMSLRLFQAIFIQKFAWVPHFCFIYIVNWLHCILIKSSRKKVPFSALPTKTNVAYSDLFA